MLRIAKFLKIAGIVANLRKVKKLHVMKLPIASLFDFFFEFFQRVSRKQSKHRFPKQKTNMLFKYLLPQSQ